MAHTEMTRLMNNLRISLPGAIDDAIRIEVFNALNDFFQGTNIWRENIEFEVTSGVTNYELTPSGPANLVRLMAVEDNNSLPVNATLDLISGELVLAYAPNQTATYTAQVALTVNDPLDREDYPVFPAWVLNLYINDITSGVLSRMMAQPAKPYSNAQLAAYHARNFQSAIANARAEANRNFTYGAQRWRFPQTFNRNKSRR